MSLVTSYRFEAIRDNTGLKSALKKQEQRIQDDEMMASRERQAKLEEAINLKSNWNEALAQASAVKQAKVQHKQAQEDMRQYRQAAVMVRQAALKQLLENEYRDYETELHQQGKAFYIKRT